MTFAKQHNLRPGDVVVCPKSEWKIIAHYLIYIRKDPDGQEVYAENNRYEGVRLIWGHQFAEENPTYFRIRRFVGTETERREAIQRAYSLIGTEYSLTSFNCEDYANFVQYKRAVSHQSNLGIGIAATVALALISGGLK